MRGYRTAITTRECKRIELSYLLKNGLIVKGATVTGGILNYTDQGGNKVGSIGIDTKYTTQEKYIRLYYTLTSSQGDRRDMDYKIELYPIPSNLGRGEVLYFVSPYTVDRLCRILYLIPPYTIFMGRNGYYGYDLMKRKYQRLYYPLQICSSFSRPNEQYWALERKLDKLSGMRATDTYKGKKTRRALRTERLLDKQEEVDERRWSPSYWPVVARRAMYKAVTNP